MMEKMQEIKNGAIGIFDSGLGGLTVAKAIHELLPHENLLYFGDTARIPYGPKSPMTVRRFAMEIAAYLESRGVKMIVVACNTASAFSMDLLRREFSIPVIGVVEPGAIAAARETKSGRIGIIGTQGTVRSRAYQNAILANRPDVMVEARPCPLFVPLVEEGILDGAIVNLVFERYLDELKEKRIDTLVLGCTHYPLLAPAIAAYMGPAVGIVDSASSTARFVKKILTQRGLASSSSDTGEVEFLVSDNPEGFLREGERFLGYHLNEVSLVRLEAVQKALGERGGYQKDEHYCL